MKSNLLQGACLFVTFASFLAISVLADDINAVAATNSVAITTNAGSPFQQALADYGQNNNHTNAERVIRLAAALDTLPPIPEEARKHFVRGGVLFKDATTTNDFKAAIKEFSAAVHLAPWWPEARYNRALADEAAGHYDWAITNLNLYLLFKLPAEEARKVQDKIYALEVKAEEAAKKKAEEQIVATGEAKIATLNGAAWRWDAALGYCEFYCVDGILKYRIFGSHFQGGVANSDSEFKIATDSVGTFTFDIPTDGRFFSIAGKGFITADGKKLTIQSSQGSQTFYRE